MGLATGAGGKGGDARSEERAASAPWTTCRARVTRGRCFLSMCLRVPRRGHGPRAIFFDYLPEFDEYPSAPIETVKKVIEKFLPLPDAKNDERAPAIFVAAAAGLATPAKPVKVRAHRHHARTNQSPHVPSAPRARAREKSTVARPNVPPSRAL